MLNLQVLPVQTPGNVIGTNVNQPEIVHDKVDNNTDRRRQQALECRFRAEYF